MELFAFVFCVKNLSPYLVGKLFTVRTDHKNLVYLANLTVSKLVRWSINKISSPNDRRRKKLWISLPGMARVNSVLSKPPSVVRWG